VAETRDNSPQDLAAEALQLTVAKGLGAGCQFIEAAGNPIIVASAYQVFAQALYRQNKGVQHMIDAGRRGIEFARDHAARIESDDPETVAKLMEIAKTISFNVGANTWPGWGDDGAEIARAFASASDRPSEMMARGYCALARKLCLETRAAALAELDQVLQRLGQEGSKAATFYQRQIAVADQLLRAGPESR
jgi:hypothetical protein